MAAINAAIFYGEEYASRHIHKRALAYHQTRPDQTRPDQTKVLASDTRLVLVKARYCLRNNAAESKILNPAALNDRLPKAATNYRYFEEPAKTLCRHGLKQCHLV